MNVMPATNVMPETTSHLHAPNMLIVDAAARLLQKEREGRIRTGFHRYGSYWQQDKAGADLTLAASLRSRGYSTARLVCYLLGEQDDLPAPSSGFDNVYNIFFCASAPQAGLGTDAEGELQERHAQRVGKLNDDVVEHAIAHMQASVQHGQPFYVVCGVESSFSKGEYDRQVNRLRHVLQQLGVEHNTLLLHGLGPVTTPAMKAA